MDDFLNRWNSKDKKEAIIKESKDQGVLMEALRDAVNRQVDFFDLICPVAFEQPPHTQKERANNMKKRDDFTKFSEQARKVLETQLDKYADERVTNSESMYILKVKPLTDYGSPLEIIKQIGSKAKYLEAVKELEQKL